MKKRQILIFLLPLMLLAACKSSDAERDVINADFAARVAELPAECFSVFADSADMSPEMLDALKFLYAYMPLPDVTDYPGQYFRDNVEVTLRARHEMPWGATVPNREFRHFVLPIRVNNENLDGHRAVFYEELRDRVAGMSMAEAILEVNHWCHEKATYQPSDSRTHSPLATVSSAIGRCGEESTFTVAALRSIGIPARQVYTPRWAHTDDNHAWVEAWAVGQWHFLGACEPEAVLDLGWFNAPAARGMLMNTRALGRYDGPEEKLLTADKYTDVNVTKNYADVDTITVTVLDREGEAIDGAKVDFRLYNYAEFYPIASKSTDAHGQAALVAGLGDLVIWASHEGTYAMQQVSVGRDKELTIVLDGGKSEPCSLDLTIVPPIARDAQVDVPDSLAAENDRRKAYEDSIRSAYVASFVDDSRGNYAAIGAFLDTVGDQQESLAKKMLASLSHKDLSDVSTEVLCDAFASMASTCDAMAACPDEDFYVDYVLSPRIYSEFLRPTRMALVHSFSDEQIAGYRTEPESWAQWVRDSIAVDKSWQPATVIMDPLSVHKLRHTNALSRDIYFVATSRALGIPARYESITGKSQYYSHGAWHDLLAAQENGAAATGELSLSYQQSGSVDDPRYYTHFTLSKIVEGRPQLLEYPEEATWRSVFRRPQALEAGDYMLISGQRQADGSVLTHVEIFELAPDAQLDIPLVLRQDGEGVKVIGSFDSESLFKPIGSEDAKSLLSATGRGYYVLGVLGSKDEPSVHAMRDLMAVHEALAASGVPVVLLFASDEAILQNQEAQSLSDCAIMGIDQDANIRHAIAENMKIEGKLPVFIIADTFNRVVFVSEGYTINLGQQIIDTLSRL